jgi:predicted nucleic acid-binding protein
MNAFRLGLSTNARPLFRTSQTPHKTDPRLVVLDTNVLIDALQSWMLPRGARETDLQRLGRVSVEWIEKRRADLCFSDYIARELRFVLPRRNVDQRTIEKFIGDMERLAARKVIYRPVRSTACGDPADLPIIGTAMAEEPWASRIITNDQKLLGMLHYQGVQINHPKFFVGLSRYPGIQPRQEYPSQRDFHPQPGF